MNANRKERVKNKKLERRKLHDLVAQTKKMQDLSLLMQQRSSNRQGHSVYFRFSPEELGVPVMPTQAQIEKLGFKRALERLNREDFYLSYPYRMKEPVTKESFAEHRAVALSQVNQWMNKNSGKEDL